VKRNISTAKKKKKVLDNFSQALFRLFHSSTFLLLFFLSFYVRGCYFNPDSLIFSDQNKNLFSLSYQIPENFIFLIIVFFSGLVDFLNQVLKTNIDPQSNQIFEVMTDGILLWYDFFWTASSFKRIPHFPIRSQQTDTNIHNEKNKKFLFELKTIFVCGSSKLIQAIEPSALKKEPVTSFPNKDKQVFQKLENLKVIFVYQLAKKMNCHFFVCLRRSEIDVLFSDFSWHLMELKSWVVTSSMLIHRTFILERYHLFLFCFIPTHRTLKNSTFDFLGFVCFLASFSTRTLVANC
jgi:hypothetical protein